jgi:hypothetical protein
VADVVLRVHVDPSGLKIAQLQPAGRPVDPRLGTQASVADDPGIVFAAGPGIRRLISGELTPAAAIDEEVLAVVSGDATLLERFAQTFSIPVAPAVQDLEDQRVTVA